MSDFLSKFENDFVKNKKIDNMKIISTSVGPLKKAINLPGLPLESIIEVKGSHMGSSLGFALKMANKAFSLILDAECFISPYIAKRYGIILENTLYSQPNSPQESFDICCKVLECKCLDYIIISSLTSILPLTQSYQWFRKNLFKLKKCLKKSNMSIIVVNQYDNCRYDILKDFSSIIFNVKKMKKIHKDGKVIGQSINIQTTKNKINFKTGSFLYNLFYENDIDKK